MCFLEAPKKRNCGKSNKRRVQLHRAGGDVSKQSTRKWKDQMAYRGTCVFCARRFFPSVGKVQLFCICTRLQPIIREEESTKKTHNEKSLKTSGIQHSLHPTQEVLNKVVFFGGVKKKQNCGESNKRRVQLHRALLRREQAEYRKWKERMAYRGTGVCCARRLPPSVGPFGDLGVLD